MPDVTPDEIARAKRWAAMQTPPVTVEKMSESACYIRCVPYWLVKNMGNLHPTFDSAWSALALALRPVFASVAPIVREECAQECDAFASVDGIAQKCAAEIRELK